MRIYSNKRVFYLVLMHMHLFLWCFFMVENCYFHLAGRRKRNLGTFLETYVGFLINVALQLFSKYYQSYIN